MQQPPSTRTVKKEAIDLPELLPITFQLITLYAMRPCKTLATNIIRYLKLAINSSEIISPGEWQSTLQKRLSQWENMSKKHEQDQLTAIKMKINKVMPL